MEEKQEKQERRQAMTYTITPEKIHLFLQLLREEERSAGTIEN